MQSHYIFPTMITPYSENGAIDYETAEKYVEWYYDRGCNGIFAICQSSEIFNLSLEERVKLNRTVWEKTKEYEKRNGKKMTVISSGHVSDSTDDQIHELCSIADSGTDALILITNRLDLNNEGDDVWIANAEKLLAALPSDVNLGLYECPYPYKRLVTPRILNWCLETGRFRYMKDTCCDAKIIAERNKILSGSQFKLLNANCQTLLDSLKSGGYGYSGIMCNFHPELYVWLCNNYDKEPQKAELIQSLIGTVGFIETGLPYPLTAKYHMTLEGIPTNNYARNRQASELTDYAKACVAQLQTLCKYFIDSVI